VPFPVKRPYLITRNVVQVIKVKHIKIRAIIDTFLMTELVFLERARKAIKTAGTKAIKAAKII
jgi:hypothetical protein